MNTEETFDEELLAAYADHFFGYGSHAGGYWFIGMEEGGGDPFEEVQGKLFSWHQRGRRELEDMGEFSSAANIPQWFKLQPTWSKFVRIIFGAEGITTDTEQVRRYQAEVLGRLGGGSCLMELLPLPSPSLGHWHYAHRSGLQQLESREAYMSHYAPRRAAHIRKQIQEHGPRAVVFSSTDVRYQEWWQKIAGVPFAQCSVDGRICYIGQGNRTVFAVTQHPVAMGVTNAYFQGIGELIATTAVSLRDKEAA